MPPGQHTGEQAKVRYSQLWATVIASLLRDIGLLKVMEGSIRAGEWRGGVGVVTLWSSFAFP